MPSAAEQFAELHRLRLAYRDVCDELERGPRQIKARQGRVRQAEEQLEETRQQLKELRGTHDRKSLDLKTNESKIADLRARLNAATNNREYDIIRGQIDADTSAKSVLEDEILEMLEKVDRIQTGIREQESRIAELRQQTQKFAGEFEQKAVELNERRDKLDSQIKQAESGLTGDLAVRYRRLLDAHGADALAPVENNVCSLCYVQVTPQSRVLLRSGHVIFCGSCGRLLYLPPTS
jgi:uncharacterized protein